MITIPAFTAKPFTPESWEQIRSIREAWKKVYKAAAEGKNLYWKSYNTTYVVTESFHGEGLQITSLDKELHPLGDITVSSEKEFLRYVSEPAGVTIEEIELQVKHD